MMYDKLLQLYLKGQITVSGLEKAVNKGWISEEEKNKIIGVDDHDTDVSRQ